MHNVYGRDDLDKDLFLIEKELNITADYSVHFITEKKMRAMNKKYRGIDSSTDVLSFAAREGEDFPKSENDLGDIFISEENVKENASLFNVSAEEEIRRLIVHGLLHLLGYDHRTNDFTSEPMLILQEQVLERLGFLSLA